MSGHVSLQDHLAAWARGDRERGAVVSTVSALAAACRDIASITASNALVGGLSAPRGLGIDGDDRKELDVVANDLIATALRHAPVAAILSEEMDLPLSLAAGAPLVAAIDPLDGSSNIDTNVSVGTIFSLLPAPPGGSGAEPAAFLRSGRQQVAAGYAIYGPQTALVLTLGAGTDIFTLDRKTGTFLRTSAGVCVPRRAREFAVNASNYRHWDKPVRAWFDDCLAGSEGPRGEDFNMRWIASMVAEAHRILTRGGIYLYPADARKGYRSGRLRLLYEANPIALLMEQAGAAASTGRAPILDHVPQRLHERVPLVFGSRDEVERLEFYHIDPHPIGERSPLFGRRGLFHA
jgi:fructose-1,6-bisphosphatase I